MRKHLFSLSSMVLLLASPMANAITIEEIIEGIEAASQQQLATVDNYWIQRNNFGISSFEYFEKLSATNPVTGEVVQYMRMVPPSELYQGSADSPISNASPTELRAAADLLRSQGPMMESAFRDEMANAELPAGIGTMMMNPPPDQPWLSVNPNDMMGMYATMLEGAATGIEDQAARDAEAREEALNSRADRLSESLSVIREETFNGRPTAVLAGTIPPDLQQANGQEFQMNNISLWVDTEKFVTLKMQIEGVARQDGETRPVSLALEELNYQPAPGCSALELPMTRTMRMSGMMSPEEEAEIAGQMQELQRQLDSMPPGQRDLIMRQMGPQMEMLESMADGGGLEMTTDVTQVSCNTGLPEPQMIVSMFTGGAPASAVAELRTPADNGSELVRVIQNRLQVLGYTPGNTNGDLDTTTVVAITQFESANDLAVTGEATQELAALLQQAIDGNLGATQPVAATPAAQPDLAAQQACLQEKMEAAQQAQQQRRGVGGLLRGIGRAASRLGDVDLSGIMRDINGANATMDDLTQAARDLGLTESDIDECRSL